MSGQLFVRKKQNIANKREKNAGHLSVSGSESQISENFLQGLGRNEWTIDIVNSVGILKQRGGINISMEGQESCCTVEKRFTLFGASSCLRLMKPWRERNVSLLYSFPLLVLNFFFFKKYYPGQKKKRPLRLCIKSEHCSLDIENQA